MLRLSHEKEEGRNAPSELWELRHNYSEGPSGTHQKSTNKITDTSFHQALLAQTAETAARPLDHHHHSELQPELKDAGLTPEFAFVFSKRCEDAPDFNQPSHMGVKNYLSLSLPKHVWHSVSLCISPFSVFIMEDFVKSGRGEADFCLILKISGFLFFAIPVPLSISVNMWIRSTW